MDTRKQNLVPSSHTSKGFLAGMLIGGLTAAGAMLLLTPQSGRHTRAIIQRKSTEFRNQATAGLGKAVAQAGVTAREMTYSLSDKSGELRQRISPY